MLAFRDLTSRADSSWLQKRVGQEALRVLQALDPKNERVGTIRELFRSLCDPYELLLDIDGRAGLFELLRPPEANELANALGLSGDPYEALGKVRITRGSNAFLLCCAFLNLPEKVQEEHFQSPSLTSVSARYGLFPHQQRAVLTAYAALGQRKRRVVLHMPTGAGKTRMAMHIVCRYLLQREATLVIWLANSEELCEQAAEEFSTAWEYLGNRSLNLHRFWGTRTIDIAMLRDGLIVAGFPKLYALAKGEPTKVAALGDRASLLVVDEAHQSIAPTYELIIQGLAARQLGMPVLGLTATPGRTWNDPEADLKLAEFFDRSKVTLDVPGYKDPVDFLVKQGFLALPIFRRIEHIPTTLSVSELKQLESDLDVPAAILKKLAGDGVRTVKIVREIERLSAEHRRTIVFATTVDHAHLLTGVLNARDISSRCVTAMTGDDQRSKNINWFKEISDEHRVIVNFGVLTTGFDAPMTSATLIARPTKSLVLYSQMVGRAIRGPKAGGNETAEIVTVVDTTLTGFGDLASAFTNWEDVW